jgi:3-oxoadipate enol-lactonase
MGLTQSKFLGMWNGWKWWERIPEFRRRRSLQQNNKFFFYLPRIPFPYFRNIPTFPIMKLSLGILFLISACASAPRTTPGYIEVPRGRLYYEVAGNGTPVVLIHGGFGDRRMWNEQFNTFARDFRVVRYDHRGFGNSTGADSAYSPVDDLVRLLDHLGISKAHLVGNSAGGAFAIDFTVLRPERVHKLVVVGSGAGGYPYKPEDIADVVAVFDAAQKEGLDKAAEMWRNSAMIPVASRDPRTADLVWQMIRDNRRMFTIEWPSEKMNPRAYARLGEIKVPTLFVIGERDTETVRKVAEATAARIPGAEVLRMPNADHLPQMVAPEIFNERVRAFLKK